MLCTFAKVRSHDEIDPQSHSHSHSDSDSDSESIPLGYMRKMLPHIPLDGWAIKWLVGCAIKHSHAHDSLSLD